MDYFQKYFCPYFFFIALLFYGCTNNMTSISDSSFIPPNERKILEQKAQNGDNKAAEKLSYHYLHAEYDYEKAIEYMRIPALSGDSRAQHNLAVHLINSQELKHRQEGVYWYRASAKSGLKNSQYNLAKLYEEGELIIENYCEAMFWYKKASFSGEIYSMVKIAEFYREGKCEKKDLVKSYSWLRLAESNTQNKSSMGKSIQNKKERLINQLSEKELELANIEFDRLEALLAKNK